MNALVCCFFGFGWFSRLVLESTFVVPKGQTEGEVRTRGEEGGRGPSAPPRTLSLLILLRRAFRYLKGEEGGSGREVEQKIQNRGKQIRLARARGGNVRAGLQTKKTFTLLKCFVVVVVVVAACAHANW